MKVFLIFICGVYINPMQVQGLYPTDDNKKCEVVTAHNSFNRELPLPCDDVARILNGGGK